MHGHAASPFVLLSGFPSMPQAYDKLANMADIVRIKENPLMLYAIDGTLLRIGPADHHFPNKLSVIA
jgi:hypothetical protein